jgi:hypothetical protein
MQSRNKNNNIGSMFSKSADFSSSLLVNKDNDTSSFPSRSKSKSKLAKAFETGKSISFSSSLGNIQDKDNGDYDDEDDIEGKGMKNNKKANNSSNTKSFYRPPQSDEASLGDSSSFCTVFSGHVNSYYGGSYPLPYFQLHSSRIIDSNGTNKSHIHMKQRAVSYEDDLKDQVDASLCNLFEKRVSSMEKVDFQRLYRRFDNSENLTVSFNENSEFSR